MTTYMLYFALIILTVLVIVFLIYKTRAHTKKQNAVNQRFLDAEDAANAVRKKDIEPELFYTASLMAFPPLPESDPHHVVRCARRTMIRFPRPMTNLELKQQYGPAQMENIVMYEDNFHSYLKAITAWAGDLVEVEDFAGAKLILDEAIALGSEFRNTYKLAADIYVRNRDEVGLQNLRFKVADNHFKDPAIRQHVVEYIDSKLASEW